MGSKARRPEDPIKAVPPVTQEDDNVKLAKEAEEARLLRQKGRMASIKRTDVSRPQSSNVTGITRQT